MSVTILMNSRAQEVGIVRWFRAPNLSGGPPSGPLVRMTPEEFRSKGFEMIKRFLREDENIRVDMGDALPVFPFGEERNYLRNSIPVQVDRDHVGHLVVKPLHFRKYELGGLGGFDPESFRRLPWDWEDVAFWACFESVVAEAS